MWPMKFNNIIYPHSSFKAICLCAISKGGGLRAKVADTNRHLVLICEEHDWKRSQQDN